MLKQLGLPFSPESFKFSEHWFLQNCFRLKLLGTRTALKIGVKVAENVISSDHQCKDNSAQFTTAPLKALSDQV